MTGLRLIRPATVAEPTPAVKIRPPARPGAVYDHELDEVTPAALLFALSAVIGYAQQSPDSRIREAARIVDAAARRKTRTADDCPPHGITRPQVAR